MIFAELAGWDQPWSDSFGRDWVLFSDVITGDEEQARYGGGYSADVARAQGIQNRYVSSPDEKSEVDLKAGNEAGKGVVTQIVYFSRDIIV